MCVYTYTIATDTSVNMLRCKGKIFTRFSSLHKELEATNYCREKRKISLF